MVARWEVQSRLQPWSSAWWVSSPRLQLPPLLPVGSEVLEGPEFGLMTM